ncbi:hypothetical protein HQ314_06445 [Rhodococcus sp. BP-332]|uniref:hypothetical protein n=1 Tax=Rhodococcus sp. BP-332 TaxID=2739447 RepID=UPI001C9A8935|nr:hypothetical protein [Rhodococcus sp. BP-332]MBY6676549.1 hypothetical protein [Rhodococcus sp. BP-332]
MTQLQLTHDEYRLFTITPDDGSAIGNVSARARLGFPKNRYGRAKDGLLAKHLILRAPGGGGAIKRAPAADESDIEMDSNRGIAIVTPPVAESNLYRPILETMRGAWAVDRGFEPIAVEDVANLGSRKTGGKWTRPDLVAVGVTTFDFVPDLLFDVITFEVKPADQVNVLAVYEALAHRRSATHAFVALHIPAVLSDSLKKGVQQVVATAAEHGIGVISFAEPSDYETWEVLLDAVRVSSPPEQVDAFVRRNLSLEGQDRVSDAVKKLRRGVPLTPAADVVAS